MSQSPQIRTLLIEGSRKEARLIQEMLGKDHEASFEVEVAPDLSAGLELLVEQAFDVALLDLSVTQRPGLEGLARLRAEAPQVPAVVLADSNDEGEKAIDQGAQDFVLKGEMTGDVLCHSLIRAAERSSAQQQAPYSDRYFRALIENAPDSIAVIGSDFATQYTSPSLKGMLGYEEGEQFGANAFEFIHPDDAANQAALLRQIMDNPGATASSEVRIRHKDGSWHFLEGTAVNHLANPAVRGIVANFRDLSERRQAEAELRRKEEFFRKLIEHVMDGMMIIGASGELIYGSPAGKRLFGDDPNVRPGIISFDYIHPEDLPRVTAAFAEAIAQPGSTRTIEARFKRPDGGLMWVEAVGTNCIDDPLLKGLVIVARDVTERKTTEEKLHKSQGDLKLALEKQMHLFEELSTPVIQIWNRVLVLPLLGRVDDRRAQHIMEVLLNKITESRSDVVVIDVTGVPSMDSVVINHLMRTTQSAAMLGAECVLAGMKPELAQSVIEIGLDLDKLVIKRDLEDGLKWAIDRTEHESIDSRLYYYA